MFLFCVLSDTHTVALGPPVQLVVVPREAAGDGLAEDGDEAQLRAQRQRVRRGDPRRDERAREVVRRRVDKVDARAALRALRRVEEVAVSGEALCLALLLSLLLLRRRSRCAALVDMRRARRSHTPAYVVP